MLRACRAVLRPSGRIAYFTIAIAPGLSERDRLRAARAGPRSVRAGGLSQSELLGAAGFVDIEERDVTPEFLVTNRGWYELREANAGKIMPLEGEEDFHDRQTDLFGQWKATEAGLLRRLMLVARTP